MTVTVLRADARNLPIPDDSVDLVVTSPPYFALRSYQDGGTHYDGQVGAEATPAEFVDALLDVTRECVRVLKPSGSMWVNLGDKYAGSRMDGSSGNGSTGGLNTRKVDGEKLQVVEIGADGQGAKRGQGSVPTKSLMGIPWRYALRCIDDLGLILRAEVIWAKPNGLPESVTDRVRRSHEQWFHFTLQPRYFSAVDEIREAHVRPKTAEQMARDCSTPRSSGIHSGNLGVACGGQRDDDAATFSGSNPLGKLPGSVWTVPTEPLKVPSHLGVDHFAAFPTEWPRRIIQGWSPAGVCVGCGEGRRPVTLTDKRILTGSFGQYANAHGADGRTGQRAETTAQITGYTCACPEPTADTHPAVVLDPFGGTGTTAHVAHALGRHGISVDLSADYCRLAESAELQDARLRKVLGAAKPPAEVVGQADLFGEIA